MRLVAERLTYSYPRSARPVLDDVYLDLASGTSTAILGPSGSGKTTLLSVLGGLISPQQGHVRCIDSDGLEYVPAEVAAWVLQTVSLLPDRTVTDNVCLGAYLDGASRAVAKERATEALSAVGLAERGCDAARVLSGGEGQRVALARALASRRPLLLADEPTGQLDASTTVGVLDALFAQNRTILLITHDEFAASRCDRILELRDGALSPRLRAPGNGQR